MADYAEQVDLLMGELVQDVAKDDISPAEVSHFGLKANRAQA